MRASFGIDIILGVITLLLMVGVIIPDWSKVVDAQRIASCHYLEDLMYAEKNIAAGSGADISIVSADGAVALTLIGSTVDINVAGEACT